VFRHALGECVGVGKVPNQLFLVIVDIDKGHCIYLLVDSRPVDRRVEKPFLNESISVA